MVVTLESAQFLDISGWQWPIDAGLMARRVDTVWIRSSIRTGAIDSYWWPLQEELRAAGVRVNTYAVWDSRFSGHGHWANLKKALQMCPVGDRHHCEIAIDVEDSVRRGMKQMEEMRILFEEASMWNGRPAWCYTSSGLWNNYANYGAVPWARNYPLWVIDYRSESLINGYPTVPSDWETVGWKAWQYSGNGNGMGQYYGTIKRGAIDLNVWNMSGT